MFWITLFEFGNIIQITNFYRSVGRRKEWWKKDLWKFIQNPKTMRVGNAIFE